MAFQLYQNENRVVVVLDSDSSCEVSFHGAKINGTLNGQPVTNGGSLEYLKQYSVDGLPGAGYQLVDGPSQLTETIEWIPGIGCKGSLNIRCTGTNDLDAPTGGTLSMADFQVKGKTVNFDLKNITTPVYITIYTAA